MRPLVVLSVLASLACAAAACSSRRASLAAEKARAVAGASCNDTAGSVACPPDDKDPSGRKLPSQGGLCTLPTCKPCGSPRVAAFRDATGAPQAGWCMCIPRSDDSGATYSCFRLADWARRTQ